MKQYSPLKTQKSSASKIVICKIGQFIIKVRQGQRDYKSHFSTLKKSIKMKKIINRSIAKQPLMHQVISTINGFTVEICRDHQSLNAAFRLRYRAYLEINAISEDEEEFLYDDFDFLPNSFVHLVWYEGQPVATIRSCIFSDQYNWLSTEGINYFPEDTQNQLGHQTRILESNRFAVDPEFQGRRSLFAQLLLFRVHALNSFAHNLTHIITSVRSNHISFYKRFLGMEQISSTMTYIPWVDADVVLMAVSVEDCLAAAIRRGMPEFDQDEVKLYADCAGISNMDNTSFIAA